MNIARSQFEMFRPRDTKMELQSNFLFCDLKRSRKPTSRRKI